MIQLEGDLTQLENIARENGIVWFEPRNGRPLAEQILNRIVFGRWGDEDLVICRTGERTVEIQCHGGRFAVARIIENAKAAGASEVRWTALESEITAEYQEVLARCVTERAAGYVLHQLQLGAEYWHSERLQQVDPRDLDQALHWKDFGRHLTQPWDVVIGGPPNVGKSSLINRLVGYERAIVFNQPGTTRDVVSVETAIEGWPVSFSDTAGQRSTVDELEARGIEQAIEAMTRADLRIVAIDQSQPRDDFTAQLIDRFPDALLVSHKADLPRHESWRDFVADDTHSVSSVTGDGIRELIDAIATRLVPRLPSEDAVYPVTARQEALLADELDRRD